MVYAKWRDRLYAFLLRRMVGPYLSTCSLQKLHESIEFHIQEGIYTLTDVDLNADYLTQLLCKHRESSPTIRRARIRKLQISLTLQENLNHRESATPSSSVAWRAMQLGRTSDQASVYLVAHVEMDGLEIELDPERTTAQQPKGAQPAASTTSTTSGVISSYVDAAISSLRLSVSMKNVAVKLYNSTQEEATPQWVQVTLATAKYHDVDTSSSNSSRSNYKTAIHKAIDFSGIIFQTGKGDDAKKSIIAKTEGSGQVSLRAVEYFRSIEDNDDSAEEEEPNETEKPLEIPQIQQDVTFTLNQRLNFSVDHASLQTVAEVATSFLNETGTTDSEHPRKSESTSSLPIIANSATEAHDTQNMTGIMKQYAEARELAERNEIRGGVLIPNSSADSDDDSMTFDAFFDANDHSFSLYQSRLEQSIMMSNLADDDEKANFVHTKIQFHLQQCGVKLVFPSDDDDEDKKLPFANDYLLLSLGEINLTSSLSKKLSDINFSVAHMEIEDSVHEISTGDRRETKEIGNVLRFVETVGDGNDSYGGLVTEAPCISLHVLMQNDASSGSTRTVDLMLEPVELALRRATLSNVQSLTSQLQLARPRTKEGTTSERKISWKFSASSPSVSFILPLGCVGVEHTKGTDCTSVLFDRCGYELPHMPISRRLSIGLSLDALSVLYDSTARDDKTDSSCSSGTTITCHRMLGFATSPRLNAKNEVVMQRADIVSSSGHAPLSLTHKVNTASRQTLEESSSFPTVPPLSSFKARQEDEDSEDEAAFSNEFTCLARSVKTEPTRGSDPQDEMQNIAESCSSAIDLYLPELVGDLTNTEATSLLNMIVATFANGEVVTSEKGPVTTSSSSSSSSTPNRAISVCIDQISLVAHQKLNEGEDSGRWYSYQIMSEGIKAHASLCGSRFKTLRFLSQELNFFEVRGLVCPSQSVGKNAPSFRDRCDNVRRRTFQMGMSVATPLFYRSQLFVPLSPESPSLLLDVISATDDNDENNGEWNVHLTIYNMTHRYDVHSEWVGRLRKLLSSTKPTDSTDDADAASTNTSQEEPETRTSLIKLFVSLADCNLDYTTPTEFSTPARMIARLSDFRFSSNLVSPPGPNQACKVSVGDLSVMVCNTRYAYNFENSRLARSANVLSPNDLMTSTKGMAPDKVLRSMNLITMLTLDSMDMLLAIPLRNHDQCVEKSSEPAVTIGLTFGFLNIYGCKDSFACFTGLIGELQLYLTALDEEAMQLLREKTPADATVAESGGTNFLESMEQKSVDRGAIPSEHDEISESLADQFQHIPAVDSRDVKSFIVGDDFSLGGQDWATVDHEWSTSESIPPNEEQCAKWYPSEDTDEPKPSPGITLPTGRLDQSHGDATFQGSKRRSTIRIIPNHIPLNPVYDPSSQRVLNAAKYAGTSEPPAVKARIFVRDLKLRCRFFDGFDWPASAKRPLEQDSTRDFVIETPDARMAEKKAEMAKNLEQRVASNPDLNKLDSRKAQLLGDLLETDGIDNSDETPFHDVPLPEERGAILQDLAVHRRLARRMNKFLQISLSGLKMHVDTFTESEDHRLASYLDLSLADFFIAETISSAKPVKLLGEWFNEVEHPRDSNDGLIMMKMVTWHPKYRVTKDDRVANDESKATLEMLPLRCHLDQRALRFASAFFAGDQQQENGHAWAAGLYEIPPPAFSSFKFRPCKLKVNYSPKKVDVAALREGSYVELVNISPIVDMVITLQAVSLKEHVGFGSVTREAVSRWIEDICATQMYKFLANAKPFQPLSSVSGGAADLFVIPWEAYRSGENVKRALRDSAKSFAGKVAYETLNTTTQLTGQVARALSATAGSANRVASMEGVALPSSPLPSRPNETPRGIGETANHALESLARGLETANYKIIIVPYREYRKHGTACAVKSVVKGIPVAIAAPVGAATEALSYTLLGARNQVRPDIRKEEEASERGLRHDF